MARVKLTEYKAKQLLFNKLQIEYQGVAAVVDGKKILFSSPLSMLSSGKRYAVKVDQGVKGRMKKGLVALDVHKHDIKSIILKIAAKGFSQFVIEEIVPHEQSQEHYLSFERVREGILVRYSSKGGIHVEDAKDQVQSFVMHDSLPSSMNDALQLPEKFFKKMREFFEENYISFLEINPLVVSEKNWHILDLAIEVDSTAAFFVKNSWADRDIVGDQVKSEEEQKVKHLNDKSQAALSFTLLNPNGSIWNLLSGGGASITIADEIYNLGYGKEMGNYGEYSGNPNKEETYLYTSYVLQAMLKSKKKKLILIIGGGVANFTDIRTTFKGVVQALEEYKNDLKKRKILIYVRRGGPFQEEGLAMISAWAQKNGMYGYVSGPELPLHAIVQKAISSLRKSNS